MIVENGQTNVTTYFVLRDSVEHLPKTDIDVTTLDLFYVKTLAAISAKVDCAALPLASSPWAANSGYNVGQGVYRIDWPDEAFTGGVGEKVQLIVVCDRVDTTFFEVLLSPSVNLYNIIDTVEDIAPAVLDDIIEGTYTFRQIGRAILSLIGGKTLGCGTASPIFRDTEDTKDRISVLVDSSNNRISVVLDLS